MRVPAFTCAVGVTILCAALSTGCSKQPGSLANAFRMGERVTAGTLIYNVLDTEWRSQLGEGLEAKQPAHRFLLVTVTVTNSGGEECAIPPLVLTAANGQTYQEIVAGESVPEWLGMLRKLGPANTEHGRVVFDAPLGSYKLRVSSDAGLGEEQVAYIDLPLRLEPDGETKLKEPSLTP